MTVKRHHDPHARLRGRNLGVFALLLGFAAALFLATVATFGKSGGVAGNPSAGQGGAWIEGFIKRTRE